MLSGYPDQYTLLKYQMSWPGSGDPYYTQEGGDRRTFYSVNSVPRLEIDGGYDGNPSSLTAQEFDSYAAIPSFTSIDANYSVDSQSVDINVSIDPLENLSSSNLKLHYNFLSLSKPFSILLHFFRFFQIIFSAQLFH